MSWKYIILLWIVVYIAHSIVFKKVADQNAKTKRQYWMYVFCLILSSIFCIVRKEQIFTFALLFILGMGIANSLACFFHWRAIAISQSKSSMFSQLNNLIAIVLGYYILHESKFLNDTLLLGIFLSFLAIFFLIFIEYKKSKRKKIKSYKIFNLIGLVIIYSVIWGLLDFLTRYFAIQEISFSQFLIGWYGGSFLGSLIILLSTGKEQIAFKIPKKNIITIFFVALFTWLNILISYWIMHHAPLIVAQPIFMVGTTVIPFIVGLFIFKEFKGLSKTEFLALLAGLVGSLVIIFSFS